MYDFLHIMQTREYNLLSIYKIMYQYYIHYLGEKIYIPTQIVVSLNKHVVIFFYSITIFSKLGGGRGQISQKMGDVIYGLPLGENSRLHSKRVFDYFFQYNILCRLFKSVTQSIVMYDYIEYTINLITYTYCHC